MALDTVAEGAAIVIAIEFFTDALPLRQYRVAAQRAPVRERLVASLRR